MGSDDDRRARAIELRAAGWTVDAIKKELRVGSTKLAGWLAGRPLPPRPRHPRAKDELRAHALELRRRGQSYRQIGETLPVAKSTLSSWLRDVPLSDEQRAHLLQRKADGVRSRAIAIRAGRVRRTQEIRTAAAAEVGALTSRELFLLGIAAYRAEGTKSKPWSVSSGVTFINSDAQMIELFVAWLRLIGVSGDRIAYRVSIHESANVETATQFWADRVGVDAASFLRPSLKRHNPKTVRRNVGVAYVGCLVVRVRRSTDLNRRIEGWWSGIAAGLASAEG